MRTPQRKGSNHLERLRRRKCGECDQRGVFHDDLSDWVLDRATSTCNGHSAREERTLFCGSAKTRNALWRTTGTEKCALPVSHWAPQANGVVETLTGSHREAFSEPTRQQNVSTPPGRMCGFSRRARWWLTSTYLVCCVVHIHLDSHRSKRRAPPHSRRDLDHGLVGSASAAR